VCVCVCVCVCVQHDELSKQLESAKREKESSEVKMMTLTSVMDNAKWELESALARRTGELEAAALASDALKASAKKLEAELAQVRAAAQLELDGCRRACDATVAGKEDELKEMRTKLSQLHDQLLHEKQVSSDQLLGARQKW